MYGSIFRGVSDGCYLKDSKVGGRKYAILSTALAWQYLQPAMQMKPNPQSNRGGTVYNAI